MTPAERSVATHQAPGKPAARIRVAGPSSLVIALPLSLLLCLAGCGGTTGGPGTGGGGNKGGVYPVGGSVSGLVGTGLVLRNNGGDDVAVPASGQFTFANKLAVGASYAITILSQPTNPNQTCEIFNPTGTVDNTTGSAVALICTTIPSGTFIGVDFGVSGDRGSLGTRPLDGAGNFTSNSTENNAGTISSGIFDSGAYAVSYGGVINFNAKPGYVSADSNAIVSADVSKGAQPYIHIEVRQTQGASTNADLKGTYKFVTYGNSGDSSTLWTVVADGSGNFTGSEVQNNAGVISASSAIVGPYTVAIDGTVTLSPSGPPLTGAVSLDGSSVVLSQLTSGSAPSMTVGVKQGQSAFSTTDVSAEYAIVTENNSADADTLWYFIFDPKGNVSGSGTHNAGGTISFVNETGTFSVAADGALTVSLNGGQQLTGGISADGKRLVLTSVSAGGSPSIWVGIRTAEYDPWGY